MITHNLIMMKYILHIVKSQIMISDIMNFNRICILLLNTNKDILKKYIL